jgi:nucleoside diphosphate kinase
VSFARIVLNSGGVICLTFLIAILIGRGVATTPALYAVVDSFAASLQFYGCERSDTFFGGLMLAISFLPAIVAVWAINRAIARLRGIHSNVN